MTRLPPGHATAAKAPSPRGRAPSTGPHVPRPPWAPVQLKPSGVPPPAAEAAPNLTGLPDGLKAGVEALSGLAMDDVRVHRNSAEPARLGAHAFTSGSAIHLGPGQERHLPHEAWHVVQQKQGRVRPTAAIAGLGVNEDPALEQDADLMGGRAAFAPPGPAPLGGAPAAPAAPLWAVAQLIKVDASDIGQDFVIFHRGTEHVGRLVGFTANGWYRFQLGLTQVNVQGQGNILRRSDSNMDGGSDESSDRNDENEESGSENEMDDIPGASDSEDEPDPEEYSPAQVPATANSFNIGEVARSHNVNMLGGLMMIRNRFENQPQTVRLHYSFGSKTVTPGVPAFNTPAQSEKGAQAMVSYRQADYAKHKKVGKDYEDWADYLSESEEDEETKQTRAQNMVDFLEGDEDMGFDEMSAPQKASMGGLFSVALISDPLRTEHNSRRTERDFMEQLRARARGETTFHNIFGSKSASTFLPARSGGSAQQRALLRERTKKELSGHGRLLQNNCLINAISQGHQGQNATIEQLMNIRFNLGNVGEMMVAVQGTIDVIRNVLGIDNAIIVRYPIDTDSPDETFDGTDPPIVIFHTGEDHFQHDRPNGVAYLSDDDADDADDADLSD